MTREEFLAREFEELNQEEMRLFIERLKGLMQMYNLTQRELAQRVKITEVSMSRYVNGTRQPRLIILANIARELRTSTDYLLGLTDNIAPSAEPEWCQQGWQCPICGRVYSPTTMMCLYCGNKVVINNTSGSVTYHGVPPKKELDRGDSE